MDSNTLSQEEYQKLVDCWNKVSEFIQEVAEAIISVAKTVCKAFFEFLNSTVYRNYRSYRRFSKVFGLQPIKLRNYIREKIHVKRLIKVYG